MLFLVHRWLGIVLGLLMVLWTLSGIVMMYVSYPETTSREQMAGLEPLDLSGCCAEVRLPRGAVESATVEMLADRPVLRWIGPEGPQLVSLAGPAPSIDASAAGNIAQAHMRNAFDVSPTGRVEPVGIDQWSLQLRRYAPLYKVSFQDERGTALYVSGLTGEVVQDTQRRERFWNWLGAVPHWLYFTPLRQNGQIWSQVVIYASLLGIFLTVTGLYIGVITWRRGKRWSPFRGVALWHHWTGLVFGLAALTWVFSGFASMQPWGWLESQGPGKELQAIAGRASSGRDVVALYTALAARPQPGVVSAELLIQGGSLYAVLARPDGTRTRASLPDLETSLPDLPAIARAARPGVPIASRGLIAEGDAYHYDHHSTPALLPAYRIIYADKEATRLYLDPRTGEVIGHVDSGSRAFRWWHSALHRLDFSGLNTRPLWDAIMLPLLGGVLLVCLLGAWMGLRRAFRQGY